MASARTANQIISDALKLLGNETLSTEAQIWLNNILDRLYEDYRWPFQEATATGTQAAGDNNVALPSTFADLWNNEAIRLTDSEGNCFTVRVMTADEYNTLISPDEEGQPESAYIDYGARTITYYPVPEQSYTYLIRYKSKPARVSDFDAVVTFPNDMLLTQAVFVRGLQHEDDDRYVPEAQILESMIKSYLKGFNVSPGKGKTLKRYSRTFKNICTFR